MASPKKKLATTPDNSAKTDPEVTARMAKNTLRPSLNGALTINALARFTNPEMAMALINELSDQASAVRGGDMSRAEAMLTVQAHTLDFLFNSYVQRADKAEYLKQCEGFMRLALKAQAQCRSTVEALSAMKNPRVQYVNQQNVAVNQQVNNDAGSSTRGPTGITKDELLEASPATRFDIGVTVDAREKTSPSSAKSPTTSPGGWPR